MSQATANFAILLIGCLVVVTTTVKLVRRRWVIRQRSAAALVFAVACSINLPNALGSIFHGRQTVYEPSGDAYQIFAPWVRAVRQASVLLLLVVLLVFVIRRVANGGGIRNTVPLAAAAICGVAAINGGMRGESFGGAPMLTFLVVFIALSWIERGPGFSDGAALAVIVLASSCSLQAAISPESGWRACRGDKCGPFGALYIGSFSNENELGLLLALGLSFVLLSTRGRHRLLVASFVLLLAYATGSRTSLLAVGSVLAAFLVIWGTRGLPRILVSGSIVAVLVVVAVLPFYGSYGPDSYSTRGSLWSVALNHASLSPWFGLGGTAWPQLVLTGEIHKAAEYSAHNEVLDTYFMAGIAGLVLLLLLAVGVWRQMESSSKLILIAPGLVAGILERPWGFSHVDWLTWSLVAVLGYGTGGGRSVAASIAFDESSARRGTGAGSSYVVPRRRQAILTPSNFYES